MRVREQLGAYQRHAHAAAATSSSRIATHARPEAGVAQHQADEITTTAMRESEPEVAAQAERGVELARERKLRLVDRRDRLLAGGERAACRS